MYDRDEHEPLYAPRAHIMHRSRYNSRLKISPQYNTYMYIYVYPGEVDGTLPFWINY